MEIPSSTAGTAAASSAAKDRIGLADDFDSFLQLLTTQLKNQDPLAPLDANQFTQQLVQFSAVEQAIKTNDALGRLLATMRGDQIARSVDYLGAEVEAEGQTIRLGEGGPARVRYRLDQSAAQVRIEIYDGAGRLVATRQGETGAGSHSLDWNGAGPERRAAARRPLPGRGRRERCRGPGGAGHDHDPRHGRRRRDRWRPPHAVDRRRADAAGLDHLDPPPAGERLSARAPSPQEQRGANARPFGEEIAMSLFGSLFSAVSGLSAQSQAMGMISDNVSNVNTVSYKAAVAQFSTLVTRSAASATYSPGGVQASTLYRINQQGLIQASSSPTDVAIDGSGFFVVNSRADGSGEQLYTRAGSFEQDFLGNLVNDGGFYLQGWALDANEEIININQVGTVNVQVINGLAAATTDVELGANLNATQTAFAGVYAAGDLADYADSGGVTGVQPHMVRSVQVFDSLGAAHNVEIAFLKDAAANTWSVEIYADSAEVEVGDHPAGLLASGTITFNGDGTLASTAITPNYPAATLGAPIGINWLDSSGPSDSSITLDLGTIDSASGLSQFASDYNVAFVIQNGAEVGDLNGVTIDDEGFVIATFTNGATQKIYKLPLATFANPLALDPRTGNVFVQTAASGEFNLRSAGEGGAGVVSPSALEAANVDLADEFTKMIVTQRAYSANARIITTADEMLDELIRISR